MAQDFTQRSAERRRVGRGRVDSDVFLLIDGERRRHRASNLSAGGIFLEGAGRDLAVGHRVELVFPVTLRGVIRLHRKYAIVAHVTRSGVGMRLLDSPSPGPRA